MKLMSLNLNLSVTEMSYFIDYEDGPLQQKREPEHSAEFSEDTDCDGSSLPEDSPKVQMKLIRLYEMICWLYVTFTSQFMVSI